MDDPVLWIGTVACAGAAATGLVASSRRHVFAALLAALLIAPALVVGDNWESTQIVELRDSPGLLALAAAVAIAAIAGLVRLFRSRPHLVPLFAIAALPFRIPIELGDEAANLLLPLYAVIIAAVLARLLDPGESESTAPPSVPLRLIAPLLASFLVLYAVQAAYADDISAATENVAFFLAPFAALFAVLRTVEWNRSLLRTALIIVIAEAMLFSLVGLGQYAVGELFWNDKVIAGNEAHAWFRVNSLFWDPNIMGRYLAVAMVLVGAAALWARSTRTLVVAAGLFAILLLAQTATFSQSSMIALLAGLGALGLARWGGWTAAGLLAIIAAGIAAAAVLFAGGGIEVETSGRESLIRGGVELAQDRPVGGHGSGSFSAEFREQFGGADGVAVASHTEPVTVAAEQGAIGLVVYAALILAGFWAAARGAGLFSDCGRGPIGAALLGAYAAMFVHSLGYAAFFVDPITWVLLALLTSTSLAASSTSPTAPAIPLSAARSADETSAGTAPAQVPGGLPKKPSPPGA